MKNDKAVADRVLMLLLLGATFALGCQELYDSDIWWHVRAGQWIVENRQFPRLDPFTFTSSDRPWIDLHWLFQVTVAAAFGLGGARGMILMAAGLGTAAILVASSAVPRARRGPAWVTAACWLPAVVLLSARYAPRPELFSMLGMAAYLAVLERTDSRPEVAWILPFIQAIWVNAQGLFVLGPIILGIYLVDRLAGWSGRVAARRWWGHVGGAAVLVGLACLANPYGLRGALFPLELFPKITAWGGLYKSEIIEFMDWKEFVRKQTVPVAAGNLYNRAECFLFWMLPLSAIVPAVWRSDGARRGAGKGGIPGVMAAFAMGVGLILLGVVGLPARRTPWWLVRVGRLAPLGIVALGILGAAVRMRTSRRSALMAAIGGLAAAAWMVWLRGYLFGPEPGPAGSAPRLLGLTPAILGMIAAGLTLRTGGRFFRMLLAVMFGYLGLQAIRNANLFAIAAGYVLAANLGEWATELADECPTRKTRTAMDLLPRVIVAGLIGFLIVATVTGSVFRATGERRGFGTMASPLVYAHDAARFAGQPGFPDHAWVSSLRQAGVYVFHNGPGRKVFIDGRLEVPTRETFATYIQLGRFLNEGRPGWETAFHRMGDPAILLDHEKNLGAEATLLADSEWRCVYYDAVGSVFLARRLRDLEPRYPDVDFAARHFGDTSWHAARPKPLALAEGRALLSLSTALSQPPGADRSLLQSLALLAADRFRQVVAVDPTDAEPWSFLGESCANLVPDRKAAPLRPDDTWDPARGLLPAQSAFCYRRALERDPSESRALFALYQAFADRRMDDARQSIADRMRQVWAEDTGGDPVVEIGPGEPSIGRIPLPDQDRLDREGLERSVDALLRQGRPEAAVALFAEAERRGLVAAWSARDRVAATLLLLGQPEEARRAWERAADPPSTAVQSARCATAALAAFDFPTAEAFYREALKDDPNLGEAWFGLALMYAQRGDAAETRAACHAGLGRSLTAAQRAFLESLGALVAPLPQLERKVP